MPQSIHNAINVVYTLTIKELKLYNSHNIMVLLQNIQWEGKGKDGQQIKGALGNVPP